MHLPAATGREANAPLGPVLGERSVLLLDGAEHLRQRRLMLPPFHGERMREYEAVMQEATDRAIDSWPVGETFELLPSMQSLTLDVIMTTVFGIERGPRQEELKRRIRAVVDPVGSRPAVILMVLSGGRFGVGGSMKQFEERRRSLDELIYEEIACRREAADLAQRPDVLSMLLLARDEEGREMSDLELRDELVTLLVAGHETTATGLAWAFSSCCVTARLERLRASLADGDPAYLDAVVKETLPARPGCRHRPRRSRGAVRGRIASRILTDRDRSVRSLQSTRLCSRHPDPTAFRTALSRRRCADSFTGLLSVRQRRCLGANSRTFEYASRIRRVIERAGSGRCRPPP